MVDVGRGAGRGLWSGTGKDRGGAASVSEAVSGGLRQ